MDFENFKSLSNVHYLWSPDFLNFNDIFKIDRVRWGLQSAKIKKPPGRSTIDGFGEDYRRGNKSSSKQ